MGAPIITLTTDFGLRDAFVGVMKGVILGICAEARLVDLTHEVAPQDVLGGAVAVHDAVRFFPAGTIHLAVVDPGVGSRRRALAVRTRDACFVGPDNGLFTFVFAEPGWTAVRLEAPEYRLSPVSVTFHGRDVFAPAAAHLAAGVPLERFGPPVVDPVRLSWPTSRRDGRDVVGEVIGSDRFGNLLTSVTARDLGAVSPDRSVSVLARGRELGGLVRCYDDGPEGRVAAIVGSTGRLELFVRNGDARAALGAKRGTEVRVRPA
jgi:S-adenosylmethionine hydrolase